MRNDSERNPPCAYFFEEIEPQADGIGETERTAPFFQDIPNLKDAKSAHGAIVYQKARAILRQLEFRNGPDSFRKGLQIYTKELSIATYANNRLRLIRQFERQIPVPKPALVELTTVPAKRVT